MIIIRNGRHTPLQPRKLASRLFTNVDISPAAANFSKKNIWVRPRGILRQFRGGRNGHAPRIFKPRTFKPRIPGVEMAGDALPLFLLAMHHLSFMTLILY
jgi:hypothetical protein